MCSVVLRNQECGHGIPLVLTSPSAFSQTAEHQNSIHSSKLSSTASHNKNEPPFQYSILLACLLKYLLCSALYCSWVMVLFPNSKEKILPKWDFVSLIPQTFQICLAYCPVQCRPRNISDKWMDGERNPSKIVQTT